MDTNKESEFVRRKFTITRELDDALVELANQHYQGNVSLCIRQSIIDHQKTHRGDGRLMIKRLSQTMEQIQDDVETLTDSVESLVEQFQPEDPGHSASGIHLSKAQNKMRSDTQCILEILTESSGPLRVEDMIERMDLKPITVRRALGRLIDFGYVFEVPGDIPRYQRAHANIDCSKSDSEVNS